MSSVFLAIGDSEVYPMSMLLTEMFENLTPTKWWRILKARSMKSTEMVSPDFCLFMEELSSLSESSASVECIFSTFRFVHCDSSEYSSEYIIEA